MARKRGVTRGDVVEAAAAIADGDGLEAVTLAAVAARVGVRPPSLYAHVDGLDGLRRELALRAAASMERALRRAARGKVGVDALRSLAHGYRRFARRHPGQYAAVQRAVRPGEDDELYAALAAVVAPVFVSLKEAGARQDDLVHLARAVRCSLHGFVELERAGGFGMPASVNESFDRLVSLLVAGVEAQATAR